MKEKELVYSKTYISETAKKDFKISPELLAEEAKEGPDRYVSHRLLEDYQTFNYQDKKTREEIREKFGLNCTIKGFPKKSDLFFQENIEYKTKISFFREKVPDLEIFLLTKGFKREN
ncbi:hypothetical protein M0R19_00295 [Candidatus Pacearchaeota archaeon]|nr:hypothetical protein [Candidatus Pacearchaeota archaeon]